MPGKNRFGSLLGPVEPLPDEEPPPSRPPTTEPLAAAPAPAVEEAAPPAPPTPRAAEPEPEPEPPAPPAPAPERRRERPPTTLRVNKAAAAALWDAFLEAKTADPFLSFAQFTSGVVLDGLQRAEQRAKRRR